MISIFSKSLPISGLKYILTLAFKKYKGLYVIYIANLISILIEFLGISILGMISQQGVKIELPFFCYLDKEELFMLFIFLFLVRFISMFILESWITYYAKELQVHLSSSAFTKVVYENIKDIEKVEIGHYVTLSGDEASNASQVLISMTGIINGLLLISVYIIAVYLFSSSIFFLLIILFVIIAIAVKLVYKKLFSLGLSQAELRRSSSSMFLDAFNALRIVKSFSLESYMSNRYRHEVTKYFTVNSKLIIYNYLTKYIPIVLLFVMFELYLVEGYLHGKTYDIAFLVALLFMLMRLLQAIGNFAGLLGKLIGELKGIQNIVTFIQDFYISSKKEKVQDKIRDIVLDNISFSYADNQIFKDFNFSFNAGKSYAIYGESGSGKSTLLDLIMDFNSPNNGSVLINNVDVQKIQENNLTKAIMYVGQESLVFNKSIKENIELDMVFKKEELFEVLKMVKLDEMIEEFNEGIDYMLYYKGTNISGGQRQRINLARALIRKPDVLILDEATSALDSETKEYIVTRLLKEYKDKIIIFVTHDTSILPLVSDVLDLTKNKRGKQC